MVKVHKLNNLWVFYCPGCKYDHVVDSRWTFNGDLDKPTFSPSLLCNQSNEKIKCHSFIVDGKIQFLPDCFHELKGMTVDLPDYEE